MCTPSGRFGKLEVSPEVRAQWLKGGAPRKHLMNILVKADGNKELFKKRVEHIRTTSRSKGLIIESGWYTKKAMKDELGWDKDTIKGAVAYCSSKERVKTHVRRSKYNRKVLEYWVDTKTIGKFTATESEEIKDSTIAEGEADGFVLGLEPGEPSDPYRGASDDEDDDDAESSEDEGASKKGKGKGNGGRKLPKAEVQEERALEAVENVGEVLANVLRTKSRLETTMDRLREIRNEVTPSHACGIAAGFWEEISGFADTENIPSRDFLKEAARLKETKHEHKLHGLLEKFNLTARIPKTTVSLGTKSTLDHPVLRPKDFISTLSTEGKLDLLFCGHTGVDYVDFWNLWRLVQSDHPIFRTHKTRLSSCIPIWMFADEGTSQKKKALMVLEYQPILGHGSKRADDVNMSGVSITTRFLYSVLSGKIYAGKKKHQEPLHNLVKQFAQDIGNSYHEPIPVHGISWTNGVFLICLGLKGDLAALVKLGQLERNFMRDTASGCGKGICHLCRAGQENFSFHDTNFDAMTNMRSWFKGADTATLCTYLEPMLKGIVANLDADNRHYVGLIIKALSAANSFMKTLYHSGLWLLDGERDAAILHGQQVLLHFQKLAGIAFSWNMTRWKFQPKFHFYAEVLYYLQAERMEDIPSINPISLSTQMDEDFVGRLSAA
ncbi:unnamed protein product, partial [Symbiodinium pilosum]